MAGTTILATVFVFGILVFVHELGHFMTAKWTGMQVDEFAIGFGPALYSKKYKGTLYSIRVIPLGGYNKIAGMDPDEPIHEGSFSGKSVWKRLLVIAAGALMNFVLAIVLFFGILLFQGLQQPVMEPVIGSVMTDSPAERAHLQPQDRILTINGAKLSNWTDISERLKGHGNEIVTMEIMRDGEKKTLSIIPEYKESNKKVMLGISPVVKTEYPSVWEALKISVLQTIGLLAAMLTGLYMMITGAVAPAVSGPIGVAQMAGQVAEIGIVPLLNFTALLSINLGLINLLPVPMLDGGHIVLLLWEGITRRKPSARVLYYIQMSGMAILMAIFLYAMTSDIRNLL